MTRTESTPPKGVMLKSTAFILAAAAFAAGLLTGSLLIPSSVPAPAETRAPVRPDAADADLAAHIAQVRADAARNPQDPLPWIHLGNLYFDAHQAENAISAYETALRLQPGNTDVMTDMGTMFRLAGDPQRAVEVYDQVLALDPAHQNARYNKGVTLIVDLARPAEGVAAWKELIALKPDAKLSDGTPLAAAIAPLATDAGTRLEARGRTDAALEAYRQALAETPDFEPALAHQADLLEKTGRHADAVPLWTKLLTLNPEALAPDGTPAKNRI